MHNQSYMELVARTPGEELEVPVGFYPPFEACVSLFAVTDHCRLGG